MSLPFLSKYVYNHGSDDSIRRGKKIHAIGFAEPIEIDQLTDAAVFRVRDDIYQTFYKVHLTNFRNPQHFAIRCTCPYNMTSICRHKAASLFKLQELIDQNQLQLVKKEYDQRHTVLKMRQIDPSILRSSCAPQVYDEAETYLRSRKAEILKAENETVEATLNYNDKDYKIILKRNDERNFDTSCDFFEPNYPLCIQKVIVFMQLLNTGGADYFNTIRNKDREKQLLLRMYGYTLEDNWQEKFEFIEKNGKPFLKVLDPTVKKVEVQPVAKKIEVPVAHKTAEPPEPAAPKETGIALAKKSTTRPFGLVFTEEPNFPYLKITAITGSLGAEALHTAPVSVVDINKNINEKEYTAEQLDIIQNLRKLHPVEVNRYIQRNSPFAGFWDSLVSDNNQAVVDDDTKALIVEYYLPRLHRILGNEILDGYLYYQPKSKPLSSKYLEPLTLHFNDNDLSFTVKQTEEVHIDIKIGNAISVFEDNDWESPMIIKNGKDIFLLKSTDDYKTIKQFSAGENHDIEKANWNSFALQNLIPLTQQYEVNFDNQSIKKLKVDEPQVKVLLKEQGEYLLFCPTFYYNDLAVQGGDKLDVYFLAGDKINHFKRNTKAENEFYEKFVQLHSKFVEVKTEKAYALKGTEVLKNNFFFLFIDTMKEWQVPVFGFEHLKSFKFNTSKPSTQVYVNSNTDWFDARVEIDFGGQKVTVAQVKNALQNKQTIIPLDDGTLGVLPEEWIKKYALIFKIGQADNDVLKVSKVHYSVVDELYDARNQEEEDEQYEEKLNSLQQFKKIEKIKPPNTLTKILRPYQVAGFQWLNFLNQTGWGGILADDMGLGKTLQALSILLQTKRNHDNMKALVVCPTSLLYNWENEIKKFTPEITYHIHHGGQRGLSSSNLKTANVVITTYGTLRSDIKLFLQDEYHVVIMDESQAIKNPMSKTAKSACLLRARLRICMSGTPLQNNTFDIYAQMNFLNPGMLGSVEFFKQQFAIPIDKFGDADSKVHLRKLLFPFILRRTKEQVAKDLPDKTEMILYCEMGDEQRKIYDAYRNDYRDKIMGIIDNQGIQRSQLSILQGLMKLRQICDSPAILNETEKFENHSVKIDELSRELEENMSNHKALIFSQFLGMLSLLRKKLDELGIKYEYFDGSTTAIEREKAIQNFQNQDEVRVFLISLKAGGVGLNLTAADYVYIVDPWWNPAVEQQAIDRTHRIGQTKKIFAYRMICKDTVEDKIVGLQDKKRALAKSIINDEEGFVKQLTRDDVEFLFS
jgi:superfamily II DNA or RNA helicase